MQTIFTDGLHVQQLRPTTKLTSCEILVAMCIQMSLVISFILEYSTGRVYRSLLDCKTQSVGGKIGTRLKIFYLKRYWQKRGGGEKKN